MKTTFLKKALMSATLCIAVGSSHAALISDVETTVGGAGLGAVNTILTIKSNDATESGAVVYKVTTGVGTDATTGDAKKGASQSQTYSIEELKLTNASDLRIVFNAAEPGGNSIYLDNLVLTIYSATDARVLFQSAEFTESVFFNKTNTGTGNAGFVFKLDDVDAALAQARAFTGTFGSNRIGLSATASLADGGNETFFVASISGGGGAVTEVPEPSTVALLGLGLLGAAVVRRKSAKSKNA